MPEKVGQQIREAREAKGWTQEDLAREAGVRTITVSRLERGVQAGKPVTLRRIAGALGLPADALVQAIDGGPVHQRQLLERVAASVATLAEGQQALLAGQEHIAAVLSRLEAASATRPAQRSTGSPP